MVCICRPPKKYFKPHDISLLPLYIPWGILVMRRTSEGGGGDQGMNVTAAEASIVKCATSGRAFCATAKKPIGQERGRVLPDMRGEEGARWDIDGVLE